MHVCMHASLRSCLHAHAQVCVCMHALLQHAGVHTCLCACADLLCARFIHTFGCACVCVPRSAHHFLQQCVRLCVGGQHNLDRTSHTNPLHIRCTFCACLHACRAVHMCVRVCQHTLIAHCMHALCMMPPLAHACIESSAHWHECTCAWTLKQVTSELCCSSWLMCAQIQQMCMHVLLHECMRPCVHACMRASLNT